MQEKWLAIDTHDLTFSISFTAADHSGPDGDTILLFNKWLIKKTRPRESGKNLILYFAIMVVSAFVYCTAGVFLIIWVATLLK